MASAGPYASLHLAPDRWQRQHPTTQFFTGRMPFLLFIAHWNTVAALTWAWPSHARWPPLCKYNQMQGRCLHEARHLLLAGRLVLVYTRRQFLNITAQSKIWWLQHCFIHNVALQLSFQSGYFMTYHSTPGKQLCLSMPLSAKYCTDCKG